jgi:hypothetical protein
VIVVLEVHAVEETQTQQIVLKDQKDMQGLEGHLVIRLLDGDLICMLDTKVAKYKGNKVTMVTM